MSATPQTPEQSHGWTVQHILDAAHNAADSVFHLLATVDSDWAKVKANPVYGPVLALGVKAAETELAASGVPVAALTSIAQTVESTVESYAAADPSIKTA